MKPLSEELIKLLINLAVSARDKAYAPYSGFAVGAALLCKDGETFTGVNVENAAYPACTCAENSAIAAAVSSGYREFIAIAVSGGERPLYPCGVCRQILMEFSNIWVIATDKTGMIFETSPLSELITHTFGKGDLNAGK